MPPIRRLADEPSERARAAARAGRRRARVLALQRSAGNAAVTRLLAREPCCPARCARDAPLAAPDLRLPTGGAGATGQRGRPRADAVLRLDRARTTRDAADPGLDGRARPRGAEQEFTLKDGGEGEGARQDEGRRRSSSGCGCGRASRGIADPGARAARATCPASRPRWTPCSPTSGRSRPRSSSATTTSRSSPRSRARSAPRRRPARSRSRARAPRRASRAASRSARSRAPFGQKGVKAEIKVGDLVTISGGLQPASRRHASAGRRDLEIGTIGKLIMPEEVAKVFKGTQKTFAKSAGELVRNRDDPAKVKEHGGALAEAVTKRSRRPRRARSSPRSRAGGSARSSRATARAASAAASR